MTHQAPNRSLSLGTLRPNNKTKDRSPDATGTIRIKRDLILAFYKKLIESGDDDVVAYLAGWFYNDANGRYMRVQLSEEYQRPEYRDDRPLMNFH
jgi:hypothetical protein